jgi:hypothetical protein
MMMLRLSFCRKIRRRWAGSRASGASDEKSGLEWRTAGTSFLGIKDIG